MGTDRDSNQGTKPPAGRKGLPVVEVSGAAGAACSTCRSNDWIWDEEVELVRAMNGIKHEVRAARARGDEATVQSLRTRFDEHRTQLEKVRRRRLDSLGLYDYD